MICQRRDGLMIRERYDDLELGSSEYDISAWRCLNCGAIVDPVIAAHHQTTHKTESDPLRRQRLKKLVMATLRDSSLTAMRKGAARYAQHNSFTEVHP